ncbi:flagellar hook-basal body complex protein FliE [Nocardioides pyridinolyticus]
MSVPGIEGLGFTPYVAPTVNVPSPASTQGTTASGQAFGDMVLDGLDRLEAVQDKADQLSVQAATGTLDDIHDYTIAATEASVTTQLTVAVRNRALEAFTEIMRMPIG